jgi:hypothetical protein
MRVILQAADHGDSLVLQARAAKASLDRGRPDNGFHCFRYEDGSVIAVKWNKSSVTVWPQSLSVRSA